MAAWLLILSHFLIAKTEKIIIKVMAVIAFSWTFFELYQQGWKLLHADSFRFYEVSLIILSIIYFLRLLTKE